MPKLLWATVFFLVSLTAVAQSKAAPVASTPQPAVRDQLDLAIVLLGSRTTFDQQKNAAAELVKRSVRPGDRVLIVTAMGAAPKSTPELKWNTTAYDALYALKGARRDVGFPDAFAARIETEASSTDRLTYETNAENYHDTVFEKVFTFMAADPTPAKRMIVMFRDPFAHSPGIGNSKRFADYMDTRHKEIIREAQANHVTIEAIGLDGLALYAAQTNNGYPAARVSPPVNPYQSPVYQLGDPRVTGSVWDGTAQSATTTSNPRGYDESIKREMEFALATGRQNLEKLVTATGGQVYWSNRSDFKDVVKDVLKQLNH